MKIYYAFQLVLLLATLGEHNYISTVILRFSLIHNSSYFLFILLDLLNTNTIIWVQSSWSMRLEACFVAKHTQILNSHERMYHICQKLQFPSWSPYLNIWCCLDLLPLMIQGIWWEPESRLKDTVKWTKSVSLAPFYPCHPPL